MKPAVPPAFILSLALAVVAGVYAAVEKARPTEEFIETIGVCTHWSYPDTPYGPKFAAVRDSLLSCGIRHVRDGFYRSDELGKVGIKLCVGADVPSFVDGGDTTISRIVASIKDAIGKGALIDGVEGPNEPDIFWAQGSFRKSYKGVGYQQGDSGLVQGSLNFQKDLYRVLKADPVTRNIPVIGPAIVFKRYPDGSLTDFVDYGNFHPYPGGGNSWSLPEPYGTIDRYFWESNQPSVNLKPWSYAFDQYWPAFKPKPMAATETGYNTSTGGISLTVHGKYIPRLFAEYFVNGIQRTYLYEFVDEWDLPSYGEANFGLLKSDLSAKPAFRALKSLIGLLNDRGAPFVTDSLDYTIDLRAPDAVYTRTEYVHHLLLQKRDGRYFLLIWHEISNNDISTNPPREITVPDMPATITFRKPQIGAVTVHRLDDTGRMSSAPAILSGTGSISLGVPDRIAVLELAKKPVIAAGGRLNGSAYREVSGNRPRLSMVSPAALRGAGKKTRIYSLRGELLNGGRRTTASIPLSAAVLPVIVDRR